MTESAMSGSNVSFADSSGSNPNSQATKEKAQEALGQAQEKANDVKQGVQTQMSDQLDQRSTQLGEQVRSFSDAFRKTGEQLREQGNERPANAITQVSQQIEQASDYLIQHDGERLMNDFRQFARRQPWVVAAGGLVAGFAASRLLKASSSSSSVDAWRDDSPADWSHQPATTPVSGNGFTDGARSGEPIGGRPTAPGNSQAFDRERQFKRGEEFSSEPSSGGAQPSSGGDRFGGVGGQQ